MSRGSAGVAKFGFGALGVALALAAMGGASIAQPKNAGDLLPTGQAPAATDPAAANAALDKGRELFGNYGCANCHTLGDAGATGHVGPSFDGDANLTEDFVINRVTNGQGAMPSFSGQMSADEMAAVAAYVVHAASK